MDVLTLNKTANESSLNGTFSIFFEPPSMHVSLITLFLIFQAVVILLGIGGNVFVFYTIYNLRRKSVTHFFMASFAGSDILMATVCIPFTVLSNLVFHYWPFGAAMCPIVGFVQVTSVLQRSFTLITITMDQHQVVWRPLRKRIDKRKARLIICCLWVLAAFASTPVAVFTRIVKFSTGDGRKGACMETWPTNQGRYIYSIVIMVIQYFLPLGLMIVCYTHIGIIVWLKKCPGEFNQRQNRRQSESKRKTLKMLISVAVAYGLSWLPLHTLTLVGDALQGVYDLPHVDVLWMSFHCLAFSNTCVNPIIYYTTNSAFKRSLKKCLNCQKSKEYEDTIGMRNDQRKCSVFDSTASTKFNDNMAAVTKIT